MKWLGYLGGTIEKDGQRLFFYADDNSFCYRVVRKEKGKMPVPFGPGYPDYFSLIPSVPTEAFAAWDANWSKR